MKGNIGSTEPMRFTINPKIHHATMTRPPAQTFKTSGNFTKLQPMLISAAVAANQVAMMQHDIEAYRGALGYSIPGNHDGKLCDGTTPKCGLCEARKGQS